MKEIIRFEQHEVEVWRRPRQKRMYLTVRDDGRLRVTCNLGLSRARVLDFVARNRAFVARNLPPPALRWLSGDTLLFFGRRYPLKITWTFDHTTRVEAADDAIELTIPVGRSIEVRAAALQDFFTRRGRAHLATRTYELSARTGLVPSSIQVRGQNARWGSCTSRGRVSLNWKLVAAPPAVIDYVIIHELAHLAEMNHSPDFWRLVARHDPDFETSRRWLRENQRAIHRQFTAPARSLITPEA